MKFEAYLVAAIVAVASAATATPPPTGCDSKAAKVTCPVGHDYAKDPKIPGIVRRCKPRDFTYQPCNAAYCCVPVAPSPELKSCRVQGVACATYQPDPKIHGVVKRCKARPATDMQCSAKYCCALAPAYGASYILCDQIELGGVKCKEYYRDPKTDMVQRCKCNNSQCCSVVA